MLTTYFAAPGPAAPPRAFPERTEREQEILALIEQRRTNPEIAARLGLRPKTIRNQVSNIFDRLQVADRAEAGMGHRSTKASGCQLFLLSLQLRTSVRDQAQVLTLPFGQALCS